MDCRQAFDIDLAGFLDTPREAQFDGFRAHYPRCQACSAEVRAWTELHAQLSAQSHPAADALARYEQLPAAERMAIDRHTAACPACREEMRLLAAFDPAALARPAAVARPTLEQRTRGWTEALARLLWHPGFAYGLALLIVVPILWRTQGPGRYGESALAPPSAVVAERFEPLADAVAEREVAAQQPAPSLEAVAKRPAASKAKAGAPALAAAPEPKTAAPALAAAPEPKTAAPPLAPAPEAVARAPEPKAPVPGRAPAPVARSTQEFAEQAPVAIALEQRGAQVAESQTFARREQADVADTEDAGLAVARQRKSASRVAAAGAAEGGSADSASAVASEFDSGAAAFAQAPNKVAGSLDAVVLASAPEPISISVPVGAGDRRVIDLVVSDASGARTLRRRVEAALGNGTVQLEMARAWLAPGEYRVAVHDGTSPARVFALRVVER